MTSRIEKLKARVFAANTAICGERARWLTESYRETEGQAMPLRRAKAFQKVLENMKIYIAEDELIVGNFASAPRSAPLFPEFGIAWLKKELDWLPTRPLEPFAVPEDVRAMVDELELYWAGKTHEDYANNLLREILPEQYQYAFNWSNYSMNQVISCPAHMSTGDGHIMANYGRAIDEGLQSVINTATQKIAEMDADAHLLNVDKKVFYKSVIIVCQGMIRFAERFAEEAERLMLTEPSAARRAELQKIAQTCRHVPRYPARDFQEALQAYWFIHMGIQLESNGHSISPGRFDQYLFPYYEQDIKNGTIDRALALELVECFFIKCNELIKIREWTYTQFMSGFAMFQTLALGGIDAEGNDAVNEISYIALDATKELKLPQPTTVIRLNRKNSEDFLRYSAQTLVEHGGGLPAFFNDDSGIPMLLNMGFDQKDANNWAIVGCCEPVVPGKFITVTGGMCHVNLAKCFEIALHGGTNPENGLTMHKGEKQLKDFRNIDEVLSAYQEQLAFYLQFPPIMDSVTCKAYETLTPTPFISMLIDNRLESGIDISKGADEKTFHNLLIEAHGSINVGNSVAAIKKLVFEEHKLSPEELQQLLDSDFEGIQGERMRSLLKNAAPKYGNDDDYVDQLVRDTIKLYTDGITTYVPARGGKYGPSTQGLTCNVPMGAVVGALPDGRHKGEALADNTSPTPGTDTNGPTAVVKSAAKIGQIAIDNGIILNVKFHPSALQDSSRIQKFCDFIRTYFALEGFQVQFNVVSAETLRAAQQHPEEYKTLVVKVAGYSALFSTLDERLQNQIIARTEHMF